MAEEIINSTVSHSSQTKGLAVETWQQIFWDASYMEGVEEFTTRAGAHNRLAWDNRSGKPGAARVSREAFKEALETRRRITLVCKAWYAMGIEILYSHLRISAVQWKGITLPRLSNDCDCLLAYTKRLALESDTNQYPTIVEPSVLVRRLANLCSNRLKIIELPGYLLPLFPRPNPPTTLEVALFDGGETYSVDQLDSCCPFPAAWTNLRVLDIHLGSLEFCTQTDPILFPVLEDLRVQEPPGDNPADRLLKQQELRDIGRLWTAPRLESLTILDATLSLWSQFLRRHSETLTTLCLSTFDELDMPRRHGYEGKDRDVELPNLRTFYHDWFENPPDSFIAKGVKRIGLHDLGEMNTLEDSVKRVCRTFGVWSCYPNITSCCMSGQETTIKLLENDPKVSEFVVEMKEKGITVEFIPLMGEDFGY